MLAAIIRLTALPPPPPTPITLIWQTGEIFEKSIEAS